MNIREKFYSRVHVGNPEECWEWLGARSAEGYGRFFGGAKSSAATHTALLLEGIDVPDGMVVCHSCDNPGCVNPSHLWIGTQKENLKDMRDKKRDYSRGRTVTHCPKGHEYSEENTRVYRGRRHCRQCDRDRNAWNENRKEKARERNARNRQASARKAGIV